MNEFITSKNGNTDYWVHDRESLNRVFIDSIVGIKDYESLAHCLNQINNQGITSINGVTYVIAGKTINVLCMSTSEKLFTIAYYARESNTTVMFSGYGIELTPNSLRLLRDNFASHVTIFERDNELIQILLERMSL